MTTRRAFLAAAFGAATARAVPAPLKIMFTKVDFATKTVTVARMEDFAQWGPSTYFAPAKYATFRVDYDHFKRLGHAFDRMYPR